MIKSDDFVQEKIKQQLAELGSQDDEHIAEYTAHVNDLPYIDLRMKAPDLDALSEVPLLTAENLKIAAFKIFDRQLHIAVQNPKDPMTIAFLKDIERIGKKPIVYVASPTSMKHVYERYADLDATNKTIRSIVDLTENHLHELLNNINTIEEFQKAIEETATNEKRERISKLIELTMAGAIHFGASDIHIEPESELTRVRFRIDGYLSDVYFTDSKTFDLMNSRLKLLSGMKLSNHSSAQDGRFTIQFGGEDIEMRVSLVPGAYGENYVMRLLDPRAANVPFEALGMNANLLEILEKSLRKPFGMILTTGPTGSGKSTTLYACLKKIHTPEKKIITIEDPIEYHLGGITQTQVDVKKEYTFLSGLRAALRQDPDAIMVGEIRDEDTAKVAVNAALTGHIVLSTLHTNSAAGSIPRLLDLGADSKILGSAISLVMAQRLCRKLCPNCKIQTVTTPNETKIITNIIGEIILNNKEIKYKAQTEYKIYKASQNGCELCHNGYKGRIGIYEGIIMNREIEKVAVAGGNEHEISDAASNQGIHTMREDGVIKILDGLTSYEEVSEVVEL